MLGTKVGVIDIGSNTVRLVVYSYHQQQGITEHENIKVVARLRNYIDAHGILSEEGVQVLKEAILAFQEMLVDYGISTVFAGATAALRQAKNGAAIIERMKRETGLTIQLLSEAEEAYFGFLAVVHSTALDSAVTIDMGGGSTEVSYFIDKQLQNTHSFPFGAVSLKQMFMKGSAMTAKELAAIQAFAREQFGSLDWLKGIGLPIIAIGGSARNIAQIDQLRKLYPLGGVHQYELSKRDMDSLRAAFETYSIDDLRKVEGLSSDRADIIVPAIEVFSCAMKIIGTERFFFSRKGLREGLMLDRVLNQEPNAFDRYSVFDGEVRALLFEYHIDEATADYFARLAVRLYDMFAELGYIAPSAEGRRLLMRSARLFYLGEYIDADAASQHTFYILTNRSINGLLHKDRVKVALLASYKNKEMFRQYVEPFESWYTRDELKELRDIGPILKFAYALNGSKRQIVQHVDAVRDESGLRLLVTVNRNPIAESYQAEKQRKQLERFCKCAIAIQFQQVEGIQWNANKTF